MNNFLKGEKLFIFGYSSDGLCTTAGQLVLHFYLHYNERFTMTK